ncbi:hypothetical protein N0V94_005448 [Neodidymelliopsis sp. IMI 364377]|nr:hypothetical protein N0V94_005448 [Neodidymelliopsis sp. IMI 364377]
MDEGPKANDAARASLPTGRSKSGPKGNDATRLLKKIRRFRSDTAPDVAFAVGHVQNVDTSRESVTYWYPTTVKLPDGIYDKESNLRNDVQSVIASRLEARGVSPELFKDAPPSWCLPKGIHEQDEWRLLLECPLSVPTDMLEKIFHLVRITPNDKRLIKAEEKQYNKTVQAVYYLREFAMTIFEARKIFEEMLLDGFDMNRNLYAWWEMVTQMKDSDTVTLRYIGQTGRDPWARHRSDVYSTSLRSFLGRFYATSYTHCKRVVQEARIFEFRDARAFKGTSQDLQDMFEQALIAVFGDGVLNTDAGGKNGFITLINNDKVTFDMLRTNTAAKLDKLAPCSEASIQKLKAYAREVAKYVNNNPTTREGYRSKHTFSAATEQMLVDQGAFQQLPDGSAAMVFFGSDLGDNHEEDEKQFFEAGGRTADVVSVLLNFFGYWEKLPDAFDEGFTKRLAQENQLPFFDYFPWYVKHKNDYGAANKYSSKYLKTSNPYVVVSFGLMPTFAATNNFKPFKSNDFTNYNASISNCRSGSADFWLNNVLGQPHLAHLNNNDDTAGAAGTEFVVIPCYHPGMLGYAGHMKELSQRLIAMVLSLAWAAMGKVVDLHQNEPIPYAPNYRLNICKQLLTHLKGKLYVTHPFGQAFARAKSEWAAASKVESDFRQSRKALASVLARPQKGFLEQKVGRDRKDKRDTSGLTVGGLAGSFELDVRRIGFPGYSKQPLGVRPVHQLRWKESGVGGQQLLEPIALPDNVVADDPEVDKRFLWYTATGIDIRDADGVSVGDRARMPNASGNANRDEFLNHWEHMTGSSVNNVLGTVLGMVSPGDRLTSERYLPASFFAEFDAPIGLPLLSSTSRTLRQSYLEPFVKEVKQRSAAQPGDVRWILDRFFAEEYPGNSESEVNLCPGSLLKDESAYEKIKHFCAKPTYKHHPHWRTLLALANITEMGMYERHMSTNYLALAAQVLRRPYKATNKRKKDKVMGEGFEIGHQVLIIGKTCPPGVIAPVGDLPWAQDVTVESDQDVAEVSDDDNEGEAEKKADSKGKGKAPATGSGKRKRSAPDPNTGPKKAARTEGSDDEDEMLFDSALRTHKRADESEDEMLLDSLAEKRKINQPRRRRNKDIGGTGTGAAGVGPSADVFPTEDTASMRTLAKAKTPTKMNAPVPPAAKREFKAPYESGAPAKAADDSSIFDLPEDDSPPEPEMKKRRKESRVGKKAKKQ